MRTFFLLGAINAFLAVALGAFGAHGLKDHVAADLIAVWNTGAQYQMYHALGLLLIAILHDRLPAPAKAFAQRAGWCFAVGIVFFAGSLYTLTLTGVKVLGAITPLGGICFLSGWALLTVAALKSSPESNR